MKNCVVDYSDFDFERFVKEKRKRGDSRTIFQIDRDRIIHSSAFRRLQAKTQVYGAGLMDFYRTRLTHSIEVAQIARSIGIRLKVDTDLLEAISLAHDIGHPPFGHTGEEVLNLVNSKYEGFDANAHNIIILCFLETKVEDKGLNLTRATLDGLLKYKSTRDENPKFLYTYDFFKSIIDWIDPEWQKSGSFESKRSLECQIVNWADNSAYSVHDLEDGIKSGLLRSQFLNDRLLEKVCKYLPNYDLEVIERVFNRVKKMVLFIENSSSEVQRKMRIKYVTSKLINDFVVSVKLKNVDGRNTRYSYKLVVNEDSLLKSRVLRAIENELIYKSRNILRTRKKCRMIIEKLFEVFSDKSSRDLYPNEYREYWDLFEAGINEEWRHRLSVWYIAGMTDNFAIRTYKEFFDPSSLIDIFVSV
ncbi:MAG: deoxyguanosinetriphosphate triphosphohydrolase family protein [Brevinematia bacterium]